MCRTIKVAAVATLAVVTAVLTSSTAEGSVQSFDPVPIGTAVYPGDPIAGWFVERNVTVRRSPSAQSALVAKGQPWHTLGVHCKKTNLDEANQTSRTWFYVTLEHREARRSYQGWVAAPAIFTSPFVPRCGPGL